MLSRNASCFDNFVPLLPVDCAMAWSMVDISNCQTRMWICNPQVLGRVMASQVEPQQPGVPSTTASGAVATITLLPEQGSAAGGPAAKSSTSAAATSSPPPMQPQLGLLQRVLNKAQQQHDASTAADPPQPTQSADGAAAPCRTSQEKDVALASTHLQALSINVVSRTTTDQDLGSDPGSPTCSSTGFEGSR